MADGNLQDKGDNLELANSHGVPKTMTALQLVEVSQYSIASTNNTNAHFSSITRIIK